MAIFDNPTNITGFNQVFTYANNVTEGIFGVGILVMIFSISFLAIRNSVGNYPGMNPKVFIASAFLTTVASVLMFLAGMVNDTTMYVCIAVTSFAAFANIISGSS